MAGSVYVNKFFNPGNFLSLVDAFSKALSDLPENRKGGYFQNTKVQLLAKRLLAYRDYEPELENYSAEQQKKLLQLCLASQYTFQRIQEGGGFKRQGNPSETAKKAEEVVGQILGGYLKTEKRKQELAQRKRKILNDLLGSGICMGHTLFLKSLPPDKRPARSARVQTIGPRARFLQAHHDLSCRMGDVINQAREKMLLSTQGLKIPNPAPAYADVIKKRKESSQPIGQNYAKLLEYIHSSKEKKGTYFLGLCHFEPYEGHSIFITFDPPAFCDINSYDEKLEPLYECFETVEQMADALSKHMDRTYSKGRFSHFTIERL